MSQYNERHGNKIFKARKKKYNAKTLVYLTKSWNVGKNYIERVLKRQSEPTRQKLDQAPKKTRLCVIDSTKEAKINYTAKNVFMAYRVRERTQENELLAYESGGPSAHFLGEESKAK